MSLYSDLNEVLTPYAQRINGLTTALTDLQNGGYVADQQKIGEKINSWLNEHPEVTTTVQDNSINLIKLSQELRNLTLKDCLIPDMFTGTDSERIQSCINGLYDTGGIIFINRMYSLTEDIISTFNTDNQNNDHAYITFIGIGKNAGINFGAYCFDGRNGSPYGGLRFYHLNMVGTATAFKNMAGLIRTVFDNCRFFGFVSVCSTGRLQNVTFLNCYFTDISGVCLEITTTIYAVNIINCIVEKCTRLIGGTNTQTWINVNIKNCTIEDCYDSPIYFGNGASGVNIEGNYFEVITNECIDLSNAFHGGAKMFGVNISGNVFVGSEIVAIKLPSTDLYPKTYAGDRVHGIISGNSCGGTLVASEFVDGNNPIRWKIFDNGAADSSFDRSVLYDFAEEYAANFRNIVPKTVTINCAGVAVLWAGLKVLIPVSEYIIKNYNITVDQVTIQTVGTYTDAVVSGTYNNSLLINTPSQQTTSHAGKGALVVLSLSPKV